MPAIRQYEAPNLGLQPTEVGIEANTQAAYRVGRFYNQVAGSTQEVGGQFARGVAGDIKAAGDVAVQYATHQEISHGAATFAQLNDDLTQRWNKTAQTADPNDPSVAAKFRETVLEPALEKYQSAFETEGGQKFAEARIDSLRNHMFEKTAADMSSLAAAAVEKNLRTTANSMSNTAMSDPSSVPHLLDNIDDTVGGLVSSSPNLKGAVAAKARMELSQKMRESIAKAGAFGAISNSSDPEATARQWAEKYPDLINGQEELQLARAAKTQARTNVALQKQTQLYQKQLDELNTHKAANDVFTKNVTIDQTTGRPILNPQYFKDALDIAKSNPNAPNAASVAKTMIDWGESQQKERPAVTDQATVTALDSRMFADGNPTTEIDVLRAEADGKLSRQDGQVRLQLIKQRDQMPYNPALKSDRNEFFKRYAGTIDGYLAQYGIHSALGQQRMFMAEKDAVTQEIALQKAGQDPHSLYDPSSPNFFGRPENMAKYHITMQQGLDFANDKGSMNLTGPGKTVTGVDVQNAPAEKPPMEGAKKAADGQWYVQKDGKWFRVKQ